MSIDIEARDAAEILLRPIATVLMQTSHPGNIGSAARALKTMGLSQLRLVEPARFPDPEAIALASGAEDVLSAAQVHATLPEALADARVVFGSSDRRRGIRMLEIDPPQFAKLALDAAALGPVAVLYGTERTGLTNEELELCQYLVTIPASPGYSSLNLASAVQVLSYELRSEALRRQGIATSAEAHLPAPNEQLERYFIHLEQVLDLVGFFGERSSTKIMRRVRRLYQRAMPDEREVQILRGILTETEVAVRGRRPRAARSLPETSDGAGARALQPEPEPEPIDAPVAARSRAEPGQDA
jgi:tRNA (cytidine32/uridine32-2'-O)-methyltransferase